MMLKIAYLGQEFHGFVRQPGLRTVEGDLLEAFGEIGCKPRIYPASRTDTGVSALFNAVRVTIQKDNICRMLTARLKDIWVYGYSFNEWNPRHCVKHYIYFLCGTYDSERLRKCCVLFSGSHDFSAFSRGKFENAKKEIEVSFEMKGDVTLLHFSGRSFLWEMIRRCVTGMKEYLDEKRTEQELANILEGKLREKVAPAPPENLLLSDLEYEFPFTLDQFSFKRMRKEFYRRYEVYSVRKALFEELKNFW